MVAAFDYCLHGKGGAAPSIDTAMHGLVDAAARRPPAPRLRHRARDGGRRRGADQGVLRRPGRRGCRGGARASSSASTSPRSSGANPQAIGVILGGHGITAWGATSDEARRNSLEIIRTGAGATSTSTAGRSRSARSCRATSRCPRRSAGRRRPRSLPVDPRARLDRPAAGRPLHRQPTSCSTSSPARSCPRLAALGTSLPGPLPAHEGPAAGPRPARRPRRSRSASPGCAELHAAYRADYRAYYERHADARLARRCAAPTRRSCWCPASGMFSFGPGQADRPGRRRVLRQRDQRDARRRGGLDATRRSPSREKFRIEYWALEEAKLAAACRSRSRWPTRIALVTGAASRHRPGDRRRGSPPRAPASSSPTSTLDERAQAVAAELGGADVAIGVAADVTDDGAVARRGRRGAARVRRRRPRRQQRRPVDLQAAARDDRAGLGPAARRDGQGLASWSSRGGGAGDDRPGAGRRHRLHLVARTRCSPARTTSPTARRRPTRPTRCGCSPPSSASTASGSTASTPTASCAARGIFAGGWGAQAGRGLRRPRGGARRVLRPAHAAEARGAARARRPRGLRAHLRRAQPHDRAAHPGRRRRRRRVPALSART